MADFPTTSPADTTEVADYLRFWAGNISVDIISEEDLASLINPNIAENPTDLCKVTYDSAVDMLNWLIRADASQNGSSGSSGDVTKRKEVRGKTTIEVEYSEVTGTDSDWDSILSNLLSNPSSIGCDVDAGTSTGNVIIGGADVNGYTATFRSRNSFGNAIKNNRYGYGNRGRSLY